MNRKPKAAKQKGNILYTLAPFAVLLIIIAVWESVAAYTDINEHVLPRFSAVITETIRVFPDFLPHLLFTLKIIILGFLMSVPLGMLTAAVLSQFRICISAFSPVILCFVITPMITLIPILILWLGTEPNLRLIVIIVQAMPIITFNTLNGFTHIEKEKLELGKSVGATKIQTFIKITFMNSMPQVFTGIKLGCIFSTIGAISADFVGGIIGMGTRIIYYTKYNATAVTYGCIILVAIIGMALYFLIEGIEKRIVIWKK